MGKLSIRNAESIELILLGMALASPKVLEEMNVDEFENVDVIRIIDDIKHCGKAGTRPVAAFSFLCSIGADREEVDELGYKDLPRAVAQLWRRRRMMMSVKKRADAIMISWNRDNDRRVASSLRTLAECHQKMEEIKNETPLKAYEKGSTETKDAAQEQGQRSQTDSTKKENSEEKKVRR